MLCWRITGSGFYSSDWSDSSLRPKLEITYVTGGGQQRGEQGGEGMTEQLFTGVEQVPDKFSFSQNFPNPFNPTTAINFGLPEESSVSIKVYNVIGREVMTLVDHKMVAGYHTVQWDSRNSSGIVVPSGIYFVRIVAGEFTATQKMLLMK